MEWLSAIVAFFCALRIGSKWPTETKLLLSAIYNRFSKVMNYIYLFVALLFAIHWFGYPGLLAGMFVSLFWLACRLNPVRDWLEQKADTPVEQET